MTIIRPRWYPLREPEEKPADGGGTPPAVVESAPQPPEREKEKPAEKPADKAPEKAEKGAGDTWRDHEERLARVEEEVRRRPTSAWEGFKRWLNS